MGGIVCLLRLPWFLAYPAFKAAAPPKKAGGGGGAKGAAAAGGKGKGGKDDTTDPPEPNLTVSNGYWLTVRATG